MNEIKCCNCGWQGTENDLAQFNDVDGGGYGCPNCNTDEYLSEVRWCNMEYTKGEWYISNHQDNNDIVVRGENEQIVANCTVDFYGGHPQGKEIQANAHLIAAAPDLLAACEAAFDYLPDPDSPLALREQLYNAIYKAKQ